MGVVSTWTATEAWLLVAGCSGIVYGLVAYGPAEAAVVRILLTAVGTTILVHGIILLTGSGLDAFILLSFTVVGLAGLLAGIAWEGVRWLVLRLLR